MSDIAPQPSPLRPAKALQRRRYSDAQIQEAMRLAATDGVRFASEQTKVPVSWLYKNLKHTEQMKAVKREAKAPKPKAERPEKRFAATGLFRKACALGEYYHANVPGDSKRNAYARASAKLGIDAGLLWKAWKYSNFTNK